MKHPTLADVDEDLRPYVLSMISGVDEAIESFDLIAQGSASPDERKVFRRAARDARTFARRLREVRDVLPRGRP